MFHDIKMSEGGKNRFIQTAFLQTTFLSGPFLPHDEKKEEKKREEKSPVFSVLPDSPAADAEMPDAVPAPPPHHDVRELERRHEEIREGAERDREMDPGPIFEAGADPIADLHPPLPAAPAAALVLPLPAPLPRRTEIHLSGLDRTVVLGSPEHQSLNAVFQQISIWEKCVNVVVSVSLLFPQLKLLAVLCRSKSATQDLMTQFLQSEFGKAGVERFAPGLHSLNLPAPSNFQSAHSPGAPTFFSILTFAIAYCVQHDRIHLPKVYRGDTVEAILLLRGW